MTNHQITAISNTDGEKNEIIVYQPEGGEFHIEVRVEQDTVWLTQAQMAELFFKECLSNFTTYSQCFQRKRTRRKKQFAFFANCKFRQARQIIQP